MTRAQAPAGGRLTRREAVADEELSSLAALMLGSAAGVPGMIAAGPIGLLVGVAAAASAFGYAEVRRWLQRDGARSFRLRRELRAAGPPIPVGLAHPGRLRIRGRVRVLEPVDLEGTPCAAWWSRQVEVERRFDGLSQSGRPVHIFEERQDCGRLAVVDETGTAIVVGPRATLGCEDAFAVFGPGGGVLRLAEGDLVEVFGEARRARIPDARRLAPVGYREAGSCLLFDRAPLVLLREPRREL